MAINQWLGTADTVAQVDTFTPGGTIEADDLFILTVAGFDGTSLVFSEAPGGTTPTEVVTALKAAWNASTNTLATGITATGTATLILTADTAGTAFKVTPSTTEAGGGAADAQTFVRAATTANGGPSDWQSATNWSLGIVPGENGASEDTYVSDSTVDILYGLDNSGASDPLLSCHISQTYTGKIGHDEEAGFEGDYLQIETATLFIGENFDNSSSRGSTRIKVDVGSTVACEITGYNTSSSSDTNKPACRLKANKSDHLIRDLRKGTYGLCFLDSETGEVASVFQSYAATVATDSQLTIGQGVTVATVEAVGGITTIKQATGKTITTVTNKGGTMLTSGAGAITTLNTEGGTVTPANTGTIATCNAKGGTTDFTASAEPRIVTNMNVASSAKLKIDTSVVTLTNGITAFESGRKQYTIADA